VWKAGVGKGVVTKRVAKQASGEDRSGGAAPTKPLGAPAMSPASPSPEATSSLL